MNAHPQKNYRRRKSDKPAYAASSRLLFRVAKLSCATTIFLAMMILAAGRFAHAAAGGATAAEFLKLGIAPRNAALGETGAASPDIAGVHYNPGALAFLVQGEASFAHLAHFQNINYSHAAAAYPTQSGTFAAAIGTLGIGNFEGYDKFGAKQSDVGASASKISLLYSNYILGDAMSPSKIGAGAGIKFVSETLDKKSAGTAAFDLGVLYSSLVADMPLAAGLSVSNLGGALKYNPSSDGEALPMTIRLGALYSLTLSENPMNLSLEAAMPSGDKTALGLGCEYIIRNTLAVRAGFTTAAAPEEALGAGFGFGIKILGVEFDYAATPGGELGYSHRAAINVKFGQQIVPYTVGMPARMAETPETVFSRGVKLFDEGRYPESIIEFNKALEADPTNSKALEYMKKASDKMKK